MPWVKAYKGESCDGCEQVFEGGEQVYRKKETSGTLCEPCADQEADQEADAALAADSRYCDEPARTDDD